jgi:serine protease Do
MVASVIAAEKTGSGKSNRVARPWLGVATQNITTEIAASLGMSKPSGVLVNALNDASPLQKAGVKVGDAIISVNGHTIRDSAEAKFRMATVPLGQKAKFEILRKGKPMTFEVEAIAPPDIPPRQETPLTGQHPLSGATIANINPAVMVEQGLNTAETGVVVVDTQAGTYGARVVSEGDIIAAINGQEINTVSDAKAALARGTACGWSLAVKRQGQILQLVIR